MDRTFTAFDRHGNNTKFELIEPGLSQEREAEIERLKAYTAALKEGVLPREKMRQILELKGVWNDETEGSFNESIKAVAKLELKLRDAIVRGDNKECTNIAGELSKERLNMFRLFLIQQTVFTNSCEGYAELIKLEAMMASCVVFSGTKQRYWANYREYVLERDDNESSKVPTLAQELQAALHEEEHKKLIADYPEQKWLKDLNAQVSAQMESQLDRVRKEVTEKLEAEVKNEAGAQDQQTSG